MVHVFFIRKALCIMRGSCLLGTQKPFFPLHRLKNRTWNKRWVLWLNFFAQLQLKIYVDPELNFQVSLRKKHLMKVHCRGMEYLLHQHYYFHSSLTVIRQGRCLWQLQLMGNLTVKGPDLYSFMLYRKCVDSTIQEKEGCVGDLASVYSY